tara:strand:+ start:840 stop:1163 length:324 start_codon:yes stop_codon:yes gene_type:complete
MSYKKTLCFDIDGTICSTDCHYNEAVPYLNVIDKINKLYEQGFKIIIFTSRGYKSGHDWTNFTKKQIDRWGVKYHKLILGKPQADIFIDDRAINIDQWCKENEVSKN